MRRVESNEANADVSSVNGLDRLTTSRLVLFGLVSFVSAVSIDGVATTGSALANRLGLDENTDGITIAASVTAHRPPMVAMRALENFLARDVPTTLLTLARS